MIATLSHRKKNICQRGLHPSRKCTSITDAGLSSSCKERIIYSSRENTTSNRSRSVCQRNRLPHHRVGINERKPIEDHSSCSILAVVNKVDQSASPTYTRQMSRCAFRKQHDWLRVSLSTILKRDLWLYMAKRAPALGSACLESEMTECVIDSRFPASCHHCQSNWCADWRITEHFRVNNLRCQAPNECIHNRPLQDYVSSPTTCRTPAGGFRHRAAT